MKQKKLTIHPSTSLLFLLFYSPKPRHRVRILTYRKSPIGEAPVRGMPGNDIASKYLIDTRSLFL